MNWLDIVLCGLAIAFAVHGAARGFTRQIIGLAAAVDRLAAGLLVL